MLTYNASPIRPMSPYFPTSTYKSPISKETFELVKSDDNLAHRFDMKQRALQICRPFRCFQPLCRSPGKLATRTRTVGLGTMHTGLAYKLESLLLNDVSDFFLEEFLARCCSKARRLPMKTGIESLVVSRSGRPRKGRFHRLLSRWCSARRQCRLSFRHPKPRNRNPRHAPARPKLSREDSVAL